MYNFGISFWHLFLFKNRISNRYRSVFHQRLLSSIRLFCCMCGAFDCGEFYFNRPRKFLFASALFGCTVLLKIIFNVFGIFPSVLPIYATVLFLSCALRSWCLIPMDTFRHDWISIIGAIKSYILNNRTRYFLILEKMRLPKHSVF